MRIITPEITPEALATHRGHWLTAKEYAFIMRMSYSTVRRHLGTMPEARKIGGQWRIYYADRTVSKLR